jgi:hypothetical protein
MPRKSIAGTLALSRLIRKSKRDSKKVYPETERSHAYTCLNPEYAHP